MRDKFLVTDTFIESILSFDKNMKASLWKCLSLLGKDCFHPSLNTEKLNGIYSSRINIDYRVIHMPLEEVYRLLYAGKHDDAYRFADNYKKQIGRSISAPEMGIDKDAEQKSIAHMERRFSKPSGLFFFIHKIISRFCKRKIHDKLTSDEIYSLKELKRHFR